MPIMDNAHALVIGIAEYHHINKLPQVQDAQHIADLLIDPNYCGFPTDNVKLLLDGQATQTALRQGLVDLAGRSNADSTVLIFFSGHGGRIESGPQAGQYLLPVDTVYPSVEDLARTAISGAEFTAGPERHPSPQGRRHLRLLPLRRDRPAQRSRGAGVQGGPVRELL